MLLARKSEERRGFAKILTQFPKWKKKAPKRCEIQFPFIVARKKEDVAHELTKNELPDLPGQQ